MNTLVANRLNILLVSSNPEDFLTLNQILSESKWSLRTASRCREVPALLAGRRTPVIIADQVLADGAWKDILSHLHSLPDPPVLIVASRLADELLWAEVLNLGGWDVLAKPFREEEVLWAVESAWRECKSQNRRPVPVSPAADTRRPAAAVTPMPAA